ncbi:MAG: uroporphyrinogen decarboxylase family protein [Eubacterium sp.]
MNVKQLTEERTKLYEDVYDMRKPKRVPVSAGIDIAAALEYCGFSLLTEQFDPKYYLLAMDKIAADFNSDNIPAGASRFPSVYKFLGAKNFVMGSDGFVQHPNVVGLNVEEYDSFISDPYKVMWDTIIPRLCPEIAKPAPYGTFALTKAFYSFFKTMSTIIENNSHIVETYGKAPFTTVASLTEAPYDFLADQVRSFTGISKDIKRSPDKVLAALDSLLPIMVKAGIPQTPANKLSRIFIPLHMAPYMNKKDFERFYWPTFKKLVCTLDEMGYGIDLFIEHDWSRFVDYLAELPKGCFMMFEYGDPKFFKEKLGDRAILSGFYPLNLLKTGTKQECLDKASELLDILAPGGNYIFNLDKSLLRLNDVNVDNYKALLNYVAENGKY